MRLPCQGGPSVECTAAEFRSRDEGMADDVRYRLQDCLQLGKVALVRALVRASGDSENLLGLSPTSTRFEGSETFPVVGAYLKAVERKLAETVSNWC